MNRFALLLAPLGLLLSAASPVVFAQTGSETLSCGEEREVEPGLMSESTYNRLNEAAELIGEEAYSDAVSLLESLRKSSLSDFEKATVEQYLGFLAAQREQYPDAIRHFSEAVRLNQLPNQTHFEMILQIAQLYNALERYDEALEQLDFWFCVSTEEAKKVAEVWVLKASLHLQQDDYRAALSAMNQAIEIAENVPETWYRTKLGILLELEEYRLAVDVAKILIEVNPDRKEYWSQLAGIYMELDESRNAMATLHLAYRRGLLDRGSEFTQLAGLLQQMEAPRLAAEVMQDGLEKGFVERTANNWEMTAGAWYQARELDRSLEAYEQAGQLSDSGRIDFQRASILTADENWEEALSAATRALEKGDLTGSQEGNAHLLVGMAQFNLGNLDQAEQAFIRASNYGTLRTAAREWLNHIEQTRQRLASR
ncbi:MAG: tetratricopeptide repeat protein [Wenzhouxiangellaceae bacterium]|nr:tetratricopeptide repeat protein [Wenzhouxiangellaceae bacterium]